MEAILIPVKRLDQSKLRLSEYLSREDRQRLVLAMLADILSATAHWRLRFVVTADSDAREIAQAFGCANILDDQGELNAALRLGTRVALDSEVTKLLILPADVPLVTESDVRKLFGFDEHVVVACSADGGTTGLLRSPPDVISPEFGPQSAAAHLQAAANAGVTGRGITLDSLTLDVDDLAGLKDLADFDQNNRQSAALARQLVLEQIGQAEGG
ncbi:MAG: 2-phospho-L-lactate guanylyltransferase [Actinomycetota bacterium]